MNIKDNDEIINKINTYKKIINKRNKTIRNQSILFGGNSIMLLNCSNDELINTFLILSWIIISTSLIKGICRQIIIKDIINNLEKELLVINTKPKIKTKNITF